MNDMPMTGDIRTRLFDRAQKSKVQYGDKTAYPADAQLMMDAVSALDRAGKRSNELYRMLWFLRDNKGECLGDHKDWTDGIDRLLNAEPFDALALLEQPNEDSIDS